MNVTEQTAPANEASTFFSGEASNEVDAPRLSKLAIAALVLGILSLLALLAKVLVTISIAGILVGIVAVWRIAVQPHICGIRLAQVGLGMCVAISVWVFVADKSQQAYLYSQAIEHGERFMKVLASGHLYEAAQLTQLEPDRQITGTDLTKYYQSLTGEDAEISDGFLKAPATLVVLDSGPNAEWRAIKRVSISGKSRDQTITVDFENVAGDSPVIRMQIRRVTGIMTKLSHSVAHWHVEQITRL